MRLDFAFAETSIKEALEFGSSSTVMGVIQDLVDKNGFKKTDLMIMLKELKSGKKAVNASDELAADEMKTEVMRELEENWKTCADDIFQNACKYDWKMAYYFIAERILHDNTYNIDGKTICGIKTFKETGRMIMYDRNEGIYKQDADITISELLRKKIKHASIDNAIKEINNSIRRSTYVSMKILTEQPSTIKPVKNGLLDLCGPKLLPFTPAYVFLDRIEINYNPAAVSTKFKDLLYNILQDPGKSTLSEKEVLCFQEWMGYCLLNDNRFQKAILLYGIGANGKSLILKIMKFFLGKDNVANISLQHLEGNNFALARLFGKSANIFFDLPKKALSQTSNLKIVTSGDSVSAEKKGKDGFDFTPYTKMMFSCNEVPRSPDMTKAFIRRWLVFIFKNVYEEGSPDRIEKLEEQFFGDYEMESILNFALEGLARLFQNKRFTEHMTEKEVMEFWVRHSDSVMAFIMDHVEKNVSNMEMKSSLYEKYCDYCADRNYYCEEVNAFWRHFKDGMDFEEKKTEQGRIIIGVRYVVNKVVTEKLDLGGAK